MPDFEVSVRVLLRDADGGEQELRYFRGLERKDLGRFVQALIDTTTQARQMAEKLSAPDGDVEKHRRQVQEVSSQATGPEAVRGVDMKLGRLAESQELSRATEEKLAWLHGLLEQTQAQVDAASKVRDEFVRETARFEKDAGALLRELRGSMETLALHKEEFETFNQRLRTLQQSLDGAEQRLEALGAHERQLSLLPERLDEFSQIFRSLMTQADELSSKQASLAKVQQLSMETLHAAARNG